MTYKTSLLLIDFNDDCPYNLTIKASNKTKEKGY
jgi:hypothetical protein